MIGSARTKSASPTAKKGRQHRQDCGHHPLQEPEHLVAIPEQARSPAQGRADQREIEPALLHRVPKKLDADQVKEFGQQLREKPGDEHECAGGEPQHDVSPGMSMNLRIKGRPAPLVSNGLEERRRDGNGKQGREDPPFIARAPAAGAAVPEEDQGDGEAAAEREYERPKPAETLKREGEADPANGNERRRAHPERVLSPTILAILEEEVEGETQHRAEPGEQ